MIALYHLIQATSHVARKAGYNWYPWSNEPYYEAVGWRGEPHDGGETVYLYVTPDDEAPVPSFHVHFGPHGDPSKDETLPSIQPTNPQQEDPPS